MTKFDKAIAAFFMPMLIFMAEAALTAEAGAVGGALAVLRDPNAWTVAVLTSLVVYAKGNAHTVYTDDPEAVRSFILDESGAASIWTLIVTVIGLAVLGACSPLSTQAAITCASGVSDRVVAGELERGSPEYKAAIVACASPLLTAAAIDSLVADQAAQP